MKREHNEIIDKYNNTDPDWDMMVALGLIPGYAYIEKFGENSEIATDVLETLWDGGGIYRTPNAPRIHDVASDSVEDIGILVSSYDTGVLSLGKIFDAKASFITDGVIPGDTILIDTMFMGSRVISVDSETELTVLGWLSVLNGRLVYEFSGMQSYRIVRAGGDGAGVYFVQGLGPTGLPLNEFIVLNGITPVPTVNEFLRQ